MATVGNVMVHLGGDATGLVRAVGTATGSLTSFVGHVAKIGGLISGALSVIGGLGIGMFTKQVTELGHELVYTSEKTGVSVEMLSALRLAAGLNRVEFGDFTTALRMMQRNLANTDIEGQAAQGKLAELGFTAADIGVGMKDAEGFLEIFAKRLASIDDPAKRVGAAMAVMGRQCANLIPLLLDIAERGLSGVRAESDALGVTFSTKLALSADRFADNMERLWAALGGVRNKVFGPLVEALAAVSEQFLKSNLFSGIQKQIDDFIKSGKLEEFAKSFLFGTVDVIAKGAVFIAKAVNYMVVNFASAVNGMARGLQNFTGMLFQFFGSFRDAMAQALEILPTILTIGAVLQAAIGNVPAATLLGTMSVTVSSNMETMRKAMADFGTGTEAALARANRAFAQFNASGGIQTPPALEEFAGKVEDIATKVQKFSTDARKNFDQVKTEIQRNTKSADALTQPLDDATTSTGELVKVSGNVAIMYDQATGQITAMNSALFGTLNLVRAIKAEGAIQPVQ